MTSKNYLCKGIKENIRRNLFLIVLIFLAFMIVFPVFCISNMNGPGYSEYMGINGCQRRLLQCLSMNSPSSWVVVVVAVLSAFIGFGYLYSGEKTDFYHSLPLKREVLYLITATSSVISFLVPYLISVWMAYMIGIVEGGNSPYLTRVVWMMISGHVVYFLVFYTGTVLAIMLTGNLFTGALGLVGIMSYGAILAAAHEEMNIRFFETIYHYAGDKIVDYLSPVVMYMKTCFDSMDYVVSLSGRSKGLDIFREYQIGMIYGIIVFVIFLILNIWLYKIRSSESYHKAIAFPKLEPVIKICSIIPIALMVGLVFSAGMHDDFLWMVISSLVAAIILSAAFDFLYTLDIRNCIKPKIVNVAILVVIGALLAGYRMDVFGIDRFLPAKDKIATMSVEFSSISQRFNYPRDYDEKNHMQNVRMKEFDAIYRLAEIGVDYTANKNLTGKEIQMESGDQEYLPGAGEEITIMMNVDLVYHLKSGEDVYRSYYIPETKEVRELVGEIYDNWEYRKKLLPTSYVTMDEIDFLYVINHMGIRRQIEGDRNKQEILFKTYKKELEEMSFENSCNQRILGYISMEQNASSVSGENYMMTADMPVYEGFTETRGMLQELGYAIEDMIPVDEVLSIRLSTTDMDGNVESEIVLDQKDEMERILKKLTYNDCRYGVGNKVEYIVNVELEWVDRYKDVWRSSYLMNDGTIDDILKQLHID